MDDVRKGQIALLFVKRQFREKGIRLTPNFKSEVEEEAKSVGIPTEEAMEFMELIVGELVEETFAKRS